MQLTLVFVGVNCLTDKHGAFTAPLTRILSGAQATPTLIVVDVLYRAQLIRP